MMRPSLGYNSNPCYVCYLCRWVGPRARTVEGVKVGGTPILLSFVDNLAFRGVNRQYGLACAVSILIFIIVASISAGTFRKTRALEDLN